MTRERLENLRESAYQLGRYKVDEIYEVFDMAMESFALIEENKRLREALESEVSKIINKSEALTPKENEK